jgi:hypothetical protein
VEHGRPDPCAEARERKTSVAAVIRDAIDQVVPAADSRRARPLEPSSQPSRPPCPTSRSSASSANRRTLALFERSPELGAFDAVLVAAAFEAEATAFISGDRAFASVPRLPFLDLSSQALRELIDRD